MKIFFTIIVLTAIIVIGNNFSLAKEPPGLAKKDKIPPGFDQGKKKGWNNGYPPGWEKNAGQKEHDKNISYEKSDKKVQKPAKEKNMNKTDDAAVEDSDKKYTPEKVEPRKKQQREKKTKKGRKEK